MKIDHIALWTHQLDTLCHFYETFFGAQSGEKYQNSQTGFESYFLTFEDGALLEIMQQPGILPETGPGHPAMGYAHIAISVGNQEEVDARTEMLRESGIQVVGEPRWTGDGLYESVVLDPDGNRVEITV